MGIFEKLKAWVFPDLSLPPISEDFVRVCQERDEQADLLRAAIAVRRLEIESRIDRVSKQLEDALKT